MNNRLEIERKLGTPLGEKGDSRQPVLKAFEKKGVLGINPTSISRLKVGMISGGKINRRLEACEVLEEDNPSFKNHFYEQITRVGLQQRTFNTSPRRTHVLKSDHYVEGIAEALREDPQVVRRCFRAMRTDMVITQSNSSDRILFGQFSDIAEDYINANRRIPPSLRSSAITLLNESWDHTTMESFYRNICRTMGGRAIGSWTPYEMGALSLFYGQQAGEDSHLTLFDRLVLNSYIKGLPASQIVGGIRRLIGIKIDEKVVEQHRNTLVYGRSIYRPK